MPEQRIQQQFFDSAELHYAAAEVLTRPVREAVDALIACITAGGKVLACGDGGSAADAQHFASLLIGHFDRERPGLAALSLSSDSAVLAGVPLDQLYARQVLALGQPGDVLLTLSADGNAANMLNAADAAHQRDMTVIALTGRGGGAMAAALTETDVHICVPHTRSARILEVHLLVIHCLCDAVDLQLLGEHDE
ncbi:MAG: SIS domain-containing protein [Leptothrix sp. (in: b-proteobacteria)]